MNREQRAELQKLLTEQMKIVELMEIQQRRIGMLAASLGLRGFGGGKLWSMRRAVNTLRDRLKLPTEPQKRVLRFLAKRRVMCSPESIAASTDIAQQPVRCMIRRFRELGLIVDAKQLVSSNVKLSKHGARYIEAFC